MLKCMSVPPRAGPDHATAGTAAGGTTQTNTSQPPHSVPDPLTHPTSPSMASLHGSGPPTSWGRKGRAALLIETFEGEGDTSIVGEAQDDAEVHERPTQGRSTSRHSRDGSWTDDTNKHQATAAFSTWPSHSSNFLKHGKSPPLRPAYLVGT
jgi:hypothetical protein